jgi:hypothetical protein
MAVTTEDLAVHLLGETEGTGPLPDLLLRLAADRLDRLYTGARPSPQMALTIAGRSATCARRMAEMTSDPGVLDHLARRDSRITVRRAVACNEATPADTQLHLMRWSLRPSVNDAGTMSALMLHRKFTWQQLFDVFADTGVPSEFPLRDLAKLVVTAGDDQALVSAFNLRLDPLDQFIVYSVDQETPSLEHILSMVHHDRAKHLLDDMLAVANKEIDIAVAQLCRTFFDDDWDTPRSTFMNTYDGSPTEPHRLTAEAAELLASSPNPRLQRMALASWNLSDDTARRFLHVEQWRVLLCHRARYFQDQSLALDLLAAGAATSRGALSVLARMHTTQPLTGQLVSAIDDLGVDNLHDLVSTAWSHADELSSAERLTLLRRGSIEMTAAWASMDVAHPNHPRPGEMTALLTDPGSAFQARYGSNHRPDPVAPESTSARVLLGYHSRAVCDGLAAGELLDAVFEPIADTPIDLNSAVKHLSLRLRERFGDDAQAFELALSLAPTWSGTVPELVDTVAGMRTAD